MPPYGGRPITPQWTGLCRVVEVLDGAYLTACRGRWPIERDNEIWSAPPAGQRLCAACLAAEGES